MNARVHSPEVLFAAGPLLTVERQDIEALKAQAAKNPRRRMRLCAHRDPSERLHEMLIALTKDAYIRPHKHLTKPESFHVVDGACDVVLFDEVGIITEIITMGTYASGRRFYYRLAEPWFHTVRIRSEFLVFHESGLGPFAPDDTAFPAWAPSVDGPEANEFLQRVDAALERRASVTGCER